MTKYITGLTGAISDITGRTGTVEATRLTRVITQLTSKQFLLRTSIILQLTTDCKRNITVRIELRTITYEVIVGCNLSITRPMHYPLA